LKVSAWYDDALMCAFEGRAAFGRERAWHGEDYGAVGFFEKLSLDLTVGHTEHRLAPLGLRSGHAHPYLFANSAASLRNGHVRVATRRDRAESAA
jgi:hypothetical protein